MTKVYRALEAHVRRAGRGTADTKGLPKEQVRHLTPVT